MPPPVVRRPLTIAIWVTIAALGILLSPVLIVLGALASALMRRPQPLLFVRILISYLWRELAVLTACAILWLASGAGAALRNPHMQALHYRLLRWFVHGLAGRIATLLDLTIAPDPSPEARSALERDQPLLFFSRHSGPIDTLLLVDVLFTRYRRLPSVVFKETLRLDPCIDLLAGRLPQAAIDTTDAERCQAQIREVTARLGGRGTLVLFPEGGNFSRTRRRRAISKLRRTDRGREAAAAAQMSHVLPPHPAGALAALGANPEADIIFSAHTGLGVAAFPSELWRETPIGETFKTSMWLARASERPGRPDEQVQWLYGWWKRIDEWVAEQGEEPLDGPASSPAPRPD